MTWLGRIFRKNKKLATLDINEFAPIPQGGILVGGALRDALLGRPFSDIDWLVEDPERAAERAALELGGSAFALDERRGHWRVVGGARVRDYIRLDGELEHNLRTRDYTVNALAATADGTLIDPTNGLPDLRKQQLRMVSRENLFDDPLRPLRGVRLAITLGFELEPDTRQTIRKHADAQGRGEAALPAWERVGEELTKLLSDAKAAYGLRLMGQLGLLAMYLSELEQTRNVQQGGFHHLDVLEHSLEALHQLMQGFPDADLPLRWATLLHDIGKPPTKTYDESDTYYHFYGHDKLGSELARSLLRRLRLPSEYVDKAGKLVRYHMLPLPKNHKEARRFVHRRREILPDLLKLMIADREAARGPLSSEASRRAYRSALSRVLEIMSAPPPPKPLLGGREVMTLLELTEGPRIGEAVRFIQEAEAVGDISSREEAEEALKNYAHTQGWL